MRALLAALPIALVVVAMVAGRWRAASAGLLGLGAALALAFSAFGFGATPGAYGRGLAAGGALVEALFTSATILWIVFPALCLYELQARSGAFDVLRSALTRLSDDPRLLALLVAWFFALFMEGVAGFGTPVALAAPILVSLGFTPVQAVGLALIGHAAGVSFGAVGTPVVPQMAATGLPALELARGAALLHALLGWILVAFLLRFSGERPLAPRHWAAGAAAALFFFVPFVALGTLIGPELPTLGGALIGGVAFALVVRRRGTGEGPGGRALARAALPYLVLLALVLATRLVPALQAGLRGIVWEWSLMDSFAGRMEPLYHPGTLLVLGFVLGGLGQGRSARELGAAAAAAARRLAPVIAALIAMLALSRVMVHAGMIRALAEAAAATGPAWPLLAPFIGVLGTFVTGSATASNILFAEFQDVTARTLGLRGALLQGAQNFGAAVGNIVCPHNIIAGGATVGLAGREGDVLRMTVPVAAVYALAGGVLVYFLA
ncbi:MAG TPA: L-lactate permease [Myxococcota bacterium]|nr:L-lactate permease [Myxococcota bacterium]